MDIRQNPGASRPSSVDTIYGYDVTTNNGPFGPPGTPYPKNIRRVMNPIQSIDPIIIPSTKWCMAKDDNVPYIPVQVTDRTVTPTKGTNSYVTPPKPSTVDERCRAAHPNDIVTTNTEPVSTMGVPMPRPYASTKSCPADHNIVPMSDTGG